MFKVGDKVRYIGGVAKGVTQGKVYNVVECREDWTPLIRIIDDEGDDGCFFFGSNFEAVEDIKKQLCSMLEAGGRLILYGDGSGHIIGKNPYNYIPIVKENTFEDIIELICPKIKHRQKIIDMCKDAGACEGEYKKLLKAKTEEDFKFVLQNNKEWVINSLEHCEELKYYGFEGAAGEYMCVSDSLNEFTKGKIYKFDDSFVCESDDNNHVNDWSHLQYNMFRLCFIKVVK